MAGDIKSDLKSENAALKEQVRILTAKLRQMDQAWRDQVDELLVKQVGLMADVAELLVRNVR